MMFLRVIDSPWHSGRVRYCVESQRCPLLSQAFQVARSVVPRVFLQTLLDEVSLDLSSEKGSLHDSGTMIQVPE